MAVKDIKIHPDAKVARQTIGLSLAPATSQANVVLAAFKPGYKFKVVDIQSFVRDETGAVTIRPHILELNDVTEGIGLAIDSTPEDFQVADFAYTIAGTLCHKAAATGISFSAADTINTGTASGSFWGAWLIQINASGTVSTKPAGGLADQVYESEAAAIQALPDPDADNLEIGYITVNANDDSAWTANTDDLTDASDCAEANFYSTSPKGDLIGSDIAFADLTLTESTLATGVETVRGDENSLIVVMGTTDGTGDLADGQVFITLRPVPLNGEVLFLTNEN